MYWSQILVLPRAPWGAKASDLEAAEEFKVGLLERWLLRKFALSIVYT